MPLGTEVGLGSGHIVSDGNSAPQGKEHSSPHTFAVYGCRLATLRPYKLRLMSIVAKRLGGSRCLLVRSIGLGPGDIVLDGDPAPPNGMGHSSPYFSAHFALARLPISATAELL